MLADGQAEDIGGTGESEAVDGYVVGDFVLFLENKILEVGGVEDFSGLWKRGMSAHVPRSMRHSAIATLTEATAGEQLEGSKTGSQSDSERNEILFDDESAYHQERGGDVHPGDVLGGQGACKYRSVAIQHSSRGSERGS